jgi:hypothetical protein
MVEKASMSNRVNRLDIIVLPDSFRLLINSHPVDILPVGFYYTESIRSNETIGIQSFEGHARSRTVSYVFYDLVA